MLHLSHRLFQRWLRFFLFNLLSTLRTEKVAIGFNVNRLIEWFQRLLLVEGIIKVGFGNSLLGCF